MKRVHYILQLFFLASLLSCSSHKATVSAPPIHVSHAYYQDWTTNIKIGSSGVNLFLANLTTQKGVRVDSVFFRDMKAKLVKSRSKYYAQLVWMLPNSQGNKLTTQDVVVPMPVNNNECIVTYTQDGETKYFKVGPVMEREGVYYDKGVPDKL